MNSGPKAALRDTARIYRDRYERTEFDLTSGLATGPFGTPARDDGGPNEKLLQGGWERPTGMRRTTQIHLAHAPPAPHEDGALWI